MTYPTDYPHLLPPNSVSLERAIAGPMGRLDHAVDVPIDTLLDAWNCPAAYLPWLAWHLSLDLWDWEWDEFKRRSVIDKAIILARSKGTAGGFKKHCEIVDTEVIQLITPPQGLFCSAVLSKEEYDAWLRTMPQLRVYLANEKGSSQGLQFLTDYETLRDGEPSDAFFNNDFFLGYDAGRSLYGRAARYWDRGVETPLIMWDLNTETTEEDALIERVSVPGKATASSFFMGGFLGTHFDVVEKEAKVYTYQENTTYQHNVSDLSMTTVKVGLTPVDVRSERISETGVAGSSLFFGRFFVGREPLSGQDTPQMFLAADNAEWMMYDRIVLHDPERAAPRVEAWSFLDSARFGFQNFTAKAVIDLKDTMHPRAFTTKGFLTQGFYLMDQDTKKRDWARRAARVSKAARDRVLVTHKLTRPMRISDGIPLTGSVPLAEQAKVPFKL